MNPNRVYNKYKDAIHEWDSCIMTVEAYESDGIVSGDLLLC